MQLSVCQVSELDKTIKAFDQDKQGDLESTFASAVHSMAFPDAEAEL